MRVFVMTYIHCSLMLGKTKRIFTCQDNAADKQPKPPGKHHNSLVYSNTTLHNNSAPNSL